MKTVLLFPFRMIWALFGLMLNMLWLMIKIVFIIACITAPF